MSTATASVVSPPGFPPNIPISQETFENWSLTINIPELWTCVPGSADDVVAVCNWAKSQGYQVRPRGIMHTWSPVTVTTNTTSSSKVLLVDTTQHLTDITFLPASDGLPARVRVQLGATMEQLLTFLQSQHQPGETAPGYSFPHVPAPGHLTVGGVLAIDAHGTAIPVPGDDLPASYGSMSNQILEFTAVVTDPSSPGSGYALRTFTRGEADAKAFLTHVGRAFLLDATLQVVPNYNLRCQSSVTIDYQTLFQAPSSDNPVPTNSLASYLNASGRVEAIWYPFSTKPWLKVWTLTPTQPNGSRVVDTPYNYPFSDNLPVQVTDLIKQITAGAAWLTPAFGMTMQLITEAGLAGNALLGIPSSLDLWGLSMNTLLYVKDSTVRYTANGYAVRMKASDVQQAVADFTAQFQSMLTAYASRLQFPVNGPVEVRVTALDDPAKVGVKPGTNAESPVISALSYDSTAAQNGWDVAVWFDVLTLPGTQNSDGFYQELEAWMSQRFTGSSGLTMVEWSKGWAYSSAGPWTNPEYLQSVRNSFMTGRTQDDNWNYEVKTLKAYDAANLFSNPFLDALFQPV